jgi:hypothetical protein
VWAGNAEETVPVETRNVDSVVVVMINKDRNSIDQLVASLDQQLLAKSKAAP